MALVLGSLYVVKQNQWGVFGAFCALIQFQFFRLILNVYRLTQSNNSPMRTTQALKSWITDDVKAAAA